MNLSEEQLIKDLTKGSESAVHALINTHQHYVYSICFSVLKVKEEAEEATQDTFLKVIKASSSYVKKGKLTTWIYPIAYRTSLDYLKRRKNLKYDVYDEKTMAKFSSSDETLLEDKRAKSIFQALDSIDPKDAGLIRMFYLDQLSIKELANHLEQSESNIKVRLHRARKKVMTILEKTVSNTPNDK